MGLVQIVTIILNMIRKTIQQEIDEFITDIIEKQGKNNMSYTKQAFSEARQKLSPKAFRMLDEELICNYYSDGEFKKYKDYRLLAADGSIIEIPNNPETQDHFGYVTNNSENLKLARALVSGLYDLENNKFIATKIDKYTNDERTLLMENIEKMLAYGHKEIKNLLLLDRGYPSIELIRYLESKYIKYLIRTSSNFLKEVTNVKSDDEIVEIEITKERARELKKQGVVIEKGTKFKLRVIKVILDTGEIETLITNLDNELSTEEAKELYFRRWGIETKYDELKNKIEIENFSGIKPLLIEQDFYASILISNLASLIKEDAEEEIEEANKSKKLKYEYKLNNNILVGKLKNHLILLLLEDDIIKRSRMYENFINLLKKNVVPIRKNRKVPRKKTVKANKYAQNRRRAL